jgi:hypothetical protein
LGCRGGRRYCSGDEFRGGASPVLAKTVHRGPIQAGTEPKRARGTRRALLGTQRGWPETMRDLCRRGAALVAGEQRGWGSGSGLSQAWHSAAPARPQESTEGLSTGVRHRRERSAGRVLPAAVKGGRRSWKEALGCAAELRVPRSVAYTGGEGRAEVKGPEEVMARANCGGGAGDVRCRWLLQSKRR